MKKIICVAIALLLSATPALAQQDDTKTEKKPKKEGGFMKFLKKTTESVTGLDVSKETLFVYPSLADWTLKVESCKGSKETGKITVIFGMTYLGSGEYYQCAPIIREVHYNKTPHKIREQMSYKSCKFPQYTKVIHEFEDKIVGVPVEVVNLEKIVFDMRNTEVFEARDVPITWE